LSTVLYHWEKLSLGLIRRALGGELHEPLVVLFSDDGDLALGGEISATPGPNSIAAGRNLKGGRSSGTARDAIPV
jgi:hypothetical protein